MNKFKRFKKYLCVMLISSMLLMLFSCDIATNVTDNVDENTKNENDTKITDIEDSDVKETYIGDNILDYEIQENDGEYYMVFDDISIYIRESSSDTLSMPVMWISFNNINEFQNDILNGKLLHFEKNIMADHFDRVENKVIIPNPYNVYTFTHPAEYQIRTTLSLRQEGYGYLMNMYKPDLNNNINSLDWNTSILTKKRYNYFLEKEFLEFTANDSIEFTKEKTLSNGKVIKLTESLVTTINCYKTEKYIMSDSNKTMFVKKLSCAYDEYVSVFILAVINGDVYCNIKLSDIDISFDEYLTDEFLFGFDVEAVERT